ncbi:DUF1844 domain-containing protein [candidate division WOR-3 bacterium]|nr:DUF1844 domain-containing protein [candidate division WOR-3 bacterium]
MSEEDKKEKKPKKTPTKKATEAKMVKEPEAAADSRAELKQAKESADPKIGAEPKDAAEPRVGADAVGGQETGAEEEAEAEARKHDHKYHEPRFMDVVFSVSAGALQGLGLGIPAADGKKFEPNLELARYSIDMLELLKIKTEGKLEEKERKFLEEMLHSLRVRYLEVANQSKEAQ